MGTQKSEIYEMALILHCYLANSLAKDSTVLLVGKQYETYSQNDSSSQPQ